MDTNTDSGRCVTTQLARVNCDHPIVVPDKTRTQQHVARSSFRLVIIGSPLPSRFKRRIYVGTIRGASTNIIFLIGTTRTRRLLKPLDRRKMLLLSGPFDATLFIRTVRVTTTNGRHLLHTQRRGTHLRRGVTRIQLIDQTGYYLIRRRRVARTRTRHCVRGRTVSAHHSHARVTRRILRGCRSVNMWC